MGLFPAKRNKLVEQAINRKAWPQAGVQGYITGISQVANVGRASIKGNFVDPNMQCKSCIRLESVMVRGI